MGMFGRPSMGQELTNQSMFGGNNGRQGIYDPDDAGQSSQALARLQQLQGDYGDKLSLNYTGNTGLMPNDMTGYARMQNAKTEAQNIQNIMGGKAPLNVRFGGARNRTAETSYAPMIGLQQAGPEGPDLKQKRVNSQAANRTARQTNPGLYGRGR